MAVDRLGQLAQPGGLVDGLPITVYSNRSLAPTLPATTWPAATPMPAWHSGTSTRSRSAIARAAASASSSGFSSDTGAPNTASTASPSNLLTSPWWRSTSSTTTAKNRLSSSTTSTAGRLVTSWVDPMMSTKMTAA